MKSANSTIANGYKKLLEIESFIILLPELDQQASTDPQDAIPHSHLSPRWSGHSLVPLQQTGHRQPPLQAGEPEAHHQVRLRQARQRHLPVRMEGA